MGLSDVVYNQYGMDKIASVSNATLANTYALDIADSSARQSVCWVFGSMQLNQNGQAFLRYRLLDSSDSPMDMLFSTGGSATSNRTYVGNTASLTQVNMSYWSGGNDNYTTYVGGEMAHFWIVINQEQSGITPIHRRSVVHRCLTHTDTSVAIGHGAAEIKDGSIARKIEFHADSTSYGDANITINATSYSVHSEYDF